MLMIKLQKKNYVDARTRRCITFIWKLYRLNSNVMQNHEQRIENVLFLWNLFFVKFKHMNIFTQTEKTWTIGSCCTNGNKINLWEKFDIFP